MTIWFDVEDLIRFFQSTSRPTGIQRLSFETYRAIWHQAGARGDVKFCRRGPGRTGYRAVHFPALEAGIMAAAETGATSRPHRHTTASPSRIGLAARRLPPQFRLPLGVVARSAAAAAGAARELGAASLAALRPGRLAGSRVGGHQFELDNTDITFAAGDWFVNIGASWVSHYDAAFVTWLHAQGVGFALLVHDLIPALYPEWCTPALENNFDGWLYEVAPNADLLFVNSQSTGRDLSSCLGTAQKRLPPQKILPMGHTAPAETNAPSLIDGPYVLTVGTLEGRKNHVGLLRVWRRLLQTMPELAVPQLVFAGKVGWLTKDLMQQLENCRWLDGKIRLIEAPSESELASLYRHCAFTVFPSLYEGWGLPVTESLSYSRPVAASNRSAIPEAGGDFCAYYDPENLHDMYEVIRGLIEQPERVADMQARIAAEFRTPTWDDTASALLTELGRPAAR